MKGGPGSEVKTLSKKPWLFRIQAIKSVGHESRDPLQNAVSTLQNLGIQVPPQVFEPSKPSRNTFSEGTWSPRDKHEVD